MIVNLSPRFKRSYKKASWYIQRDFDQKIETFINNPNHPSLKTHKLTGKLQECLAFRLKDGYRVLFEFSDSETIDLLDVGPHDIYKRLHQ